VWIYEAKIYPVIEIKLNPFGLRKSLTYQQGVLERYHMQTIFNVYLQDGGKNRLA